MGKIDDLLHENPELLEQFLEAHKDILTELRRRLTLMISQGDVVSRYLLTKALQETIQVSAEVAREALREKIAKRGLMLMPSVKDPDKVH